MRATIEAHHTLFVLTASGYLPEAVKTFCRSMCFVYTASTPYSSMHKQVG